MARDSQETVKRGGLVDLRCVTVRMSWARSFVIVSSPLLDNRTVAVIYCHERVQFYQLHQFHMLGRCSDLGCIALWPDLVETPRHELRSIEPTQRAL